MAQELHGGGGELWGEGRGGTNSLEWETSRCGSLPVKHSQHSQGGEEPKLAVNHPPTDRKHRPVYSPIFILLQNTRGEKE